MANSQGVGHHTTLHSMQEIAVQYSAFLRKVLEFGPKTPEFTNHLQAGALEFREAYDMVIEHFGVSAAPVEVNWEEVAAINDVQTIEQQVVEKVGVSAGVGGLREIFAFLVQSGLLELITKTWFKTT